MKNKIPGWPALWRIGNSKATKSSGLWLILIPIAAKSISQIQELEEKFAGSTDLQLALVLALPFRWKLLYASAASITATVPEPSSSAPGASAMVSKLPPLGTLQMHES